MIELNRPRTAAPSRACDAHMHIFDARFAPGRDVAPHGTVQDYRRLQAQIGTERTVVVQPRASGFDNAATLDAIQQLGIERTRGVAVVSPDVSDEELQALHEGGIRGIRFTLYPPERRVQRFVPEDSGVSFGMVETLAARVHAWGWHVQLHWTADQVVEYRDMLARLPTPMVFDHLARLPLPGGVAHPAFGVVRGLLDGGRAWIKLSGAYLVSASGAATRYGDVAPLARAWVRAAPERMVWGSDWPHPSAGTDLPDDALLFDLLADWAGDETTRQRILVDNPASLYGFPST